MHGFVLAIAIEPGGSPKDAGFEPLGAHLAAVVLGSFGSDIHSDVMVFIVDFVWGPSATLSMDSN